MRPRLIKRIGILLLIAIILLQGIWLVSMYQSYLTDYKRTVDQCLFKAIDQELSMRQLVGNHKMKFLFSLDQDTLPTATRKIQTDDTIFYVDIGKDEPYVLSKILQFQLKGNNPLNITLLDSIFEQLLMQDFFPVKETYIHYIDLKKNKIIRTNAPNRNFFRFYQSSIVPIDIVNSIGIQAYVKTSYFSILEKMTLQLALSVTFIIGAAYCLPWLLRGVARQQEIEQERQDFIYTIIHDITKPVAAATFLLEYATNMLKEKQIDKVSDCIDKTTHEVDRLGRYMQKIQDGISCDKQAYKFDKVKLELQSFFEKKKDQYEQIANKPIDITLQIDKYIYIFTDVTYFSNVIDNLIENSIKYSGNSVQIRIGISLCNDQIRISIWDNGWGIDKKDIEHIFDKFFRSKLFSHQEKNGLGLGLTMVKNTVEKLGGEIQVCSKYGVFTEFILLMPM